MFNFNWWRDQDNRDGAKAITDVLKVVVPAAIVVIVAIAGYLGFQSSQNDAQPANGTINCEATFTQTGDGAQTQNCIQGDTTLGGGEHQDRITCEASFRQRGDGTQVQNCIIGMTEEQFFARMEKREAEIRAELAAIGQAVDAKNRALVAEKKLLELELQQVLTKMVDRDAYDKAIEELRRLRLQLNRYENVVPQDRLEAAQQALYEGDRSVADTLLAALGEFVGPTVKLAADAAYLRGEIAAQEIRWHDAFVHYDKAARLDPTFKTLFAARAFAWRSGDYSRSFRYGEDLLKAAREGGDQRQIAAALNENGIALYLLGRFSEAEGLYREALEIGRATIGERHPNYAIRLNNLALVVKAQGRYSEAEGLYREALEIDRATIGEGHPDYAIHISNLAGVLTTLERREEAEPLYREARRIMLAVHGEDHPHGRQAQKLLDDFLAKRP